MLTDRMVLIPVGGIELEAVLTIPPKAHALVLFAQGSGPSRGGPQNNFIAARPRQHGFGTLLFDLLAPEEDEAAEMPSVAGIRAMHQGPRRPGRASPDAAY